MQLSGLYSYIARQNVIQNDIFDKIVSVVFFVIVLLYAGKGDGNHRGVLGRRFVGSLHKYHIIGSHMNTEGFIGVAVLGIRVVSLVQLNREKLVGSAYFGKIAARHYGSVLVDHPDNAVDSVLHLMYHTLKQSV